MSNLPPGVTSSMIPGNRPEDVMYEQVIDKLQDLLNAYGIGPYKNDDQRTYEMYYQDVLDSFEQIANTWARDPIEVAIRASKCEDCKEVLGKDWTYETRTVVIVGDSTGDSYEADVYIHKVCPRDREVVQHSIGLEGGSQ